MDGCVAAILNSITISIKFVLLINQLLFKLSIVLIYLDTREKKTQ